MCVLHELAEGADWSVDVDLADAGSADVAYFVRTGTTIVCQALMDSYLNGNHMRQHLLWPL